MSEQEELHQLAAEIRTLILENRKFLQKIMDDDLEQEEFDEEEEPGEQITEF
jgi:hypothetical protein